MDLRPHVEKFSRRFAEVEAALSDPKAFDNPQRAQELGREYARLKELVTQGQAYLKAVADLTETQALLQAWRARGWPVPTVWSFCCSRWAPKKCSVSMCSRCAKLPT